MASDAAVCNVTYSLMKSQDGAEDPGCDGNRHQSARTTKPKSRQSCPLALRRCPPRAALILVSRILPAVNHGSPD
jgi:hypothetical protein